jgi:S-adenosylmethionine:tRNA ribosyltransferase-isomerase
MTTTGVDGGRLAFDLPPALEAGAPPEARGLTRDAVRMLVTHRATGEIEHSTFTMLPTFLDPGDVVVVNTSATIPAALDAVAADGTPLVVHLSTQVTADRWVIELRRPTPRGTARWHGQLPPSPLTLDESATATIESPYGTAGRLWLARLALPRRPLAWLASHGRPIRYDYVERPWPLSAYQNVYALEPGSAEMPSAGRPFTPEVITRLVAKGVGVSPIVLHTGVASLEADELPYPERARVPADTAEWVNAAHRLGHRVIAVGTTVVRALESAADENGIVDAFDGWTDLVITPERGVRAVDGLLTGWHEPEASHLLMLEAVADRELLRRSYEAGLAGGYLWHEFGDVHLILPSGSQPPAAR